MLVSARMGIYVYRVLLRLLLLCVAILLLLLLLAAAAAVRHRLPATQRLLFGQNAELKYSINTVNLFLSRTKNWYSA